LATLPEKMGRTKIDSNVLKEERKRKRCHYFIKIMAPHDY